MYSASQVDDDTIDCFFECQHNGLFPYIIMWSEIDFL